MYQPLTRTFWALLPVFSLLPLGCGERSSAWDERFVASHTVALERSVAVVDEGLHRVVLLDSPSALELQARYVPVGRDVATAQASADGTHLFLLSRGQHPRRDPRDEKPRFTLVNASPEKPGIVREDELESR